MTRFPDLFAALSAQFDAQETRARMQGGRQVQYITARTAMNRLDSVLGPENWWDEYVPGENSVLCRLTVRLPDGSTLTKADAGGYAGMADQGDDDKSGFSDAFKRAAVKFGVGRYLYRDGVPSFASSVPESVVEPAQSHGSNFDPGPPPKVKPAPWGSAGSHSVAPPSPPPAPSPVSVAGTIGQPADKKAPRSGRGLYAWTKEQEQRYEVGLLKYLNHWGKLQDFPGRMVDWDENQVAQGHTEALRKLQSISTGHADGYEEAS
jgi:hypothetical protein